MRIRRVCEVEHGEVCRIYSYPFDWMKEYSIIEPEEYLTRMSTPGRWNYVGDVAQMFTFLRGETGAIVTLDGRIRVTIVE